MEEKESKHNILKSHTLHVEKGPVGKTLFFFAVPVIITQLLQEFYNIADCAVVGHFAGEYALAAAGVSGLVFSVLVNFFIGFSSGVSAISSRLFGEYRYEELKRVISSVTMLAILVGLCMTLFGVFGSEVILGWLHCPGEVLSDAMIYLKICFFGMTAQLLYNVGAAVLRSLGDTKTPMLLFSGSVVCNLILDFVLVLGFSMGIRGAAIATVLSQWLLAAAVLIRMRKMNPEYALQFSRSRDCFQPLGNILKTGIPAGMQALFMSVSSLLIQVFINQFGADAMGGMTIYAKIEGVLYFPAFAYGIALTGFVGQNYGAGKLDRVRKATRISIRTMVLVILPLSFLLMLFSSSILKLFTPDAGILLNAKEAVLCTFPVYVIYAVNQVFLGSVKGMGNTIYPMICTLVCYAVFRVAWCRILIPIYPTMRVVYFSYSVSFFLMLAMLLPVYFRQLRKAGKAVADQS